MLRALSLVVVALVAVLVATASAPGAKQQLELLKAADYPGLQHLHYQFGPIKVAAGQNTIEVQINNNKPQVPGFITRFAPNLVFAKSGKVPGVDVVHLHHGVWLIKGVPTFAAGEEKTAFTVPTGYGLHHDPKDLWLMNYMIHDLTASPTDVYLTYDIDFLPDSEAAAAGITRVRPLWMDVAGIRAYPVFDVLRGGGSGGRYTFPDQAQGDERKAIGPAHTYTAASDMTIVSAAGHLHPGGLWTDLTSTRDGQEKLLFRSEAKYWEPAGAVSWDVSMTGTKPEWRVAVRKGDRLDLSATYDSGRASWYESMGIDVLFVADGIRPEAVDPFSGSIDTLGLVTHGHLAENDNHGGTGSVGPDARKLLAGPPVSKVDILHYIYARGNLGAAGRKGRPPAVKAGKSLLFTNLDSTATIDWRAAAYHTITACKAPCNKKTGIAYPLADAKISFDSGELGYGPAGFTPAANRNTWQTPKTLPAGTYTYFCRIHPFMRGSFRVTKKG
ncbi:MAG: hypothetical protein H0W87_06340 [Actinobacteria bacterium]|nr:hypothetical protein [Actinomycetota bacterium]